MGLTILPPYLERQLLEAYWRWETFSESQVDAVFEVMKNLLCHEYTVWEFMHPKIRKPQQQRVLERLRRIYHVCSVQEKDKDDDDDDYNEKFKDFISYRLNAVRFAPKMIPKERVMEDRYGKIPAVENLDALIYVMKSYSDSKCTIDKNIFRKSLREFACVFKELGPHHQQDLISLITTELKRSWKIKEFVEICIQLSLPDCLPVHFWILNQPDIVNQLKADHKLLERFCVRILGNPDGPTQDFYEPTISERCLAFSFISESYSITKRREVFFIFKDHWNFLLKR
jgi:hypothetical protein